jgi:hypothetical protein
MKELIDVIGEIAGFGNDIAGKQCLRENGKGQFGHIDRDIMNPAGRTNIRILFCIFLGLREHLPGKPLRVAGREHRGHRLT